jgi:hypothetical protein
MTGRNLEFSNLEWLDKRGKKFYLPACSGWMREVRCFILQHLDVEEWRGKVF